MRSFRIEICCGSADDVIEAYRAGADRTELNADLFMGGLTPTVGTLQVAKKYAPIPVMCMIRPRGGGFCYTDREFDTALADARLLLDHGADGIVFGFLRPDGTIDKERCQEMAGLASGRTTVFHRAIDVVPDWRQAIDLLTEIGITRILTSGQNQSASLGADIIRDMRLYAGEKIEILPGSGITPENAANVLDRTGCSQIHMSMHKICCDTSTQANPHIHFGGALYPPEDQYKTIDGARLARFTRE